VNRGASFPILPDTIERFSNVVAQGEKKLLLEILKVVQPTIKDVHVLSRQNTTSLWADGGSKQLLPVEALGGGIVRLLVLFVNFFAARDGLIAIDEIENGIHHSALPRLWEQILDISALLNVQCVVTTHSLECVQAAVRTGENREALPDFALHQMHQQDHGRQIETYTDDKLLAALDLGFEVR
jgi:AAA15 family ATPase/GTPase